MLLAYLNNGDAIFFFFFCWPLCLFTFVFVVIFFLFPTSLCVLFFLIFFSGFHLVEFVGSLAGGCLSPLTSLVYVSPLPHLWEFFGFPGCVCAI